VFKFLHLLSLDHLHYGNTVKVDLHFEFYGSAKSAKSEVDGMDILAVKQACKFDKDHVLEN